MDTTWSASSQKRRQGMHDLPEAIKEEARTDYGDLLQEAMMEMDPFGAVSLDLFGPLIVKGLGGQCRKTFKVWGVLYVCLTTKATAIWMATGYDTASFLLCHQRQVAVYGAPSLVVLDKGSQLMAAAGDLPNWDHVQHSTAREGTSWRFVPTATPWRNGLAERVIGLAKKVLLEKVTSWQLLDHQQMETLLIQIASILNDRPLSARSFGEEDFHAITPNDLLLGRKPGRRNRTFVNFDTPDVPIHSLKTKIQDVLEKVECWWEKWNNDVFPLLATRKKWQDTKQHVQKGDIVMVKSEHKYAKDRYKLGRVMETHPDTHDVVRTVSVGARNNHKGAREKTLQCKAGLSISLVPVQKIVIILPSNEQWDGKLPVQERN